MSGPRPIVAASTMDQQLLERIARYNRELYRLHHLEDRIAEDRISNRHPLGGWIFGLFTSGRFPPPPPIQTEAREIEVIRLAHELEHERELIGSLCPVWDRLGGEPTRPKETE